MLRDFLLGSIKLHILYHANHEPVFGAELMRELARHGHDISPGTLYPTLHGMERDGFLIREERVERGRVRKYYRTTSRGQEALAQGQAQVLSLVGELLGLDAEALTAKSPVKIRLTAENAEKKR
jgi:PadR family transcriptional regulator PadR